MKNYKVCNAILIDRESDEYDPFLSKVSRIIKIELHMGGFGTAKAKPAKPC